MGVSTSIYTPSSASAIKDYLGGDTKENATPVNSSTKDIDADDWNKIIAGLAEVAQRTRYGALTCAVSFSVADAAASQTSVALARDSAGDAARTKFVAPMAGSLVAMIALSEHARTAGTLTIKWTKNGTEQTQTLVLDGTNTTKNYTAIAPAVAAFVAGDEIGTTFTTDGSWAAGSTPSVSVELLLSFEQA